jgi:hypothetical protein
MTTENMAFAACLPSITAASVDTLRKTKAEDIAEKKLAAETALLRMVLIDLRNMYVTSRAGEVWTRCYSGSHKDSTVYYEYGCTTLTGELRQRIADELRRRGFCVNVQEELDTMDVVLDVDAMTNAPTGEEA